MSERQLALLPTTSPDELDVDQLARRMQATFHQAKRTAIADAHAHGLAVPGHQDGQDVERLPNGTIRPAKLDETWSPTAWQDTKPDR